MDNPDALNVWNGQRLVGRLKRDSFGRMSFLYEQSWISEDGFAISQTLPLRSEEFVAQECVAHRFFANLLPEGGFRQRIARDLKISDTDFNLLRAIGGECAGALSILSEQQKPSENYMYNPIKDKNLVDFASQRKYPYTWAKDRKPRISLAGAQNKFPILVRDGIYLLPRQESSSSHILKFEVSEYRNVSVYETFTTLLARAIGLPVVNIELRFINNFHYTITERYDRVWGDDGQVLRTHQEDFCQALGYGHDRKYQEDGGPSFARCFEMLRDVSSDPAIDLRYLLIWQIFNVLAGNSDGHAKNLSLLYKPKGEIRLAPFYDLVCTRAIERIDRYLAMSAGNERDPVAIKKLHWEDMAIQCDIRPRYVIDLVGKIASQLLENLVLTRVLFEDQFGEYPALQRIERIVTKQCKKVTEDRP